MKHTIGSTNYGELYWVVHPEHWVWHHIWGVGFHIRLDAIVAQLGSDLKWAFIPSFWVIYQLEFLSNILKQIHIFFKVKTHLLETSLVIESHVPHPKPGSQQQELPSCWVWTKVLWPCWATMRWLCNKLHFRSHSNEHHTQPYPNAKLGGRRHLSMPIGAATPWWPQTVVPLKCNWDWRTAIK